MDISSAPDKNEQLERNGGHPSEMPNDAAKIVADLLDGLNLLLRELNNMRRVQREAVVKALRNRNPMEIRDSIERVIEKLRIGLCLVDAAIRPDPLPKIPGKPRFSVFLRKKTSEHFNGSIMRYRMASAFANTSDQNGGDIMTIEQLSESLGVEMEEINKNIRSLEVELKVLGIALEKHVTQTKSPKGNYREIDAYRFSWLREDVDVKDSSEKKRRVRKRPSPGKSEHVEINDQDLGQIDKYETTQGGNIIYVLSEESQDSALEGCRLIKVNSNDPFLINAGRKIKIELGLDEILVKIISEPVGNGYFGVLPRDVRPLKKGEVLSPPPEVTLREKPPSVKAALK